MAMGGPESSRTALSGGIGFRSTEASVVNLKGGMIVVRDWD